MATVFAQGTTDSGINPIPKVSEEWRFSVTASAWVPASYVSSYIDNKYAGSSDLSISQSLNSAGGMAMFNAEAHKGNWGLMADFVYWQINNGSSSETYVRGRSTISAGFSGTTTQSIYTGAGTYTFYKTPNWYIDALAGVRYISSTTSVTENYLISRTIGGVTRTRSVTRYPSNISEAVDPVVGVKGRARITNTSWYVPFYVDAGKGFGPDNKTWQAMTGIGKAFSWGDVSLLYRAMYFDLSSGDTLSKNTNAGPTLSITINF